MDVVRKNCLLLLVLILADAQLDDQELQILSRCVDVMPRGSSHPCWLQELWGKCNEDWMMIGQHCAKTCQRCLIFGDCTCSNVPPLVRSHIPCAQLAIDGYCDDTDFVQYNFCGYSCGRCRCPAAYQQLILTSPPAVENEPPPPPPLSPPPPSPPPPKLQSVFQQRNSLIPQQQQQQYQQPQQQQTVQVQLDYTNLPSEYAQLGATLTEIESQLSPPSPPPLPPPPPPPSPPPPSDSQGNLFSGEQNDGSQLIQDILQVLNNDVGEQQEEQPRKCFTDLLLEQGCCNILLSAIQTVGWDVLLDEQTIDSAENTIFVPVDKAFGDAEQFGINITELMMIEPPDILRQLVGYHIIAGARKVNDLRQQSTWISLANGWPIFVDITTDQRVLIRGQRGQPASIQDSDLPACNSVVQVITELLIPEQLLPATNPEFSELPTLAGEEQTDAHQNQQQSAQDTQAFNQYPSLQCDSSSFVDLESSIADIGQTATFWQWIVNSGLLPQLELVAQTAPLTLFLPRNDAVLQYQLFLNDLLDKDIKTLQDILLSHIVQGLVIREEDIVQEQSVATLAENQQLKIMPGNPFARIHGDVLANLVEPDRISTCNVTLHVVDAMQLVGTLFEQWEQQQQQFTILQQQDAPQEIQEVSCAANVHDAIRQIPELEYMLQFVEFNFQVWYLDQSSNLTLFIPREDQMQVLQQYVNSLQSSIQSTGDIIKDILEYHIIPNEKLDLEQIRNRAVLETLSGGLLYPQGGGNGVVLQANSNSATIVQQHQSCKVSIYIIDNILQPVGFGERYQSNVDVDTEQDAANMARAAPLEACDYAFPLPLGQENVRDCMIRMLSIFQDQQVTAGIQQMTLFAPVNEACNQLEFWLGQQSSEQERGLLQRRILLYHLFPNIQLSDTYLKEMGTAPKSFPSLQGSSVSVSKQFGNVYVEGVGSRGRIVEPNIQQQDACNFVVHAIDQLLLPFSSTFGPVVPSPDIVIQASPVIVDNFDLAIPIPVFNEQGSQQQQQSNNPCGQGCCSPFQIIVNDPDLTGFSSMIRIANVTNLFQNAYDLTVLAPRNQLMSEFLSFLGASTITGLSQQALLSVLQYHMLEGVWPVKLLKDQLLLKTRFKSQGTQDTYLTMQSNLGMLLPEQREWTAIGAVNNATLVRRDLEACGAVVHVIDQPLRYPGLT